jgi:predicted nucleic acid-binding protein
LVEVQDATDRSMVSHFGAEVALGEAEALALALELKADRLLIDEQQGRAIAERVGLRYIGVLGVLLEAKRGGHLNAVRPILDQLVATAGFWIGETLRREVLAAAGEE